MVKKLVAWFNDNKESPQLFDMLRRSIKSEATIKRLFQVFYQSLQLRLIVSYSVRIEETSFDNQEIIDVGRKLFLSIALHETSKLQICCVFRWLHLNIVPIGIIYYGGEREKASAN